MLLSVKEFRKWTESDPEGLIIELVDQTGRGGEEERYAWSSSLPRLADLLSSGCADELQIMVAPSCDVSLEYKLPAASYCCDAVLLGEKKGAGSALVIELKDWVTRADGPGRYEGMITRQGRNELHPSDQVRGYVEYCRRFHSEIVNQNSMVNGCVLFTRDTDCHSYRVTPNDRLVRQFPCFTLSHNDVTRDFPRFITSYFDGADTSFSRSFEKGSYIQDRGFKAQLAKQIRDASYPVIELLENQRLAFSECSLRIEQILSRDSSLGRRQVVIIEGPPGSGKSAIAARLWALLAEDERLPEGSVVFTTTSTSQNSNWSSVFEIAGSSKAGRGFVKKATSYTPTSTHRIGQIRKNFGDHILADANKWEENLKLLNDLGEPFAQGSEDLAYLVSIVDEAHALINPEHKDGRGQYGFSVVLGPQAYHIIRASSLSVFLLDPEQGFRAHENTSVDDICRWAEMLGAQVTRVNLGDAQFRCAGSVEYVTWVESLLNNTHHKFLSRLSEHWLAPAQSTDQNIRKVAEQPSSGPGLYGTETKKRRGFDFVISTTPSDMEASLRHHLSQGASCRLVSSYSREWKTKGATNPTVLPADMQDFCFENGHWAKCWNHILNNDYAHFVQEKPGTQMAEDPLVEVGCPYVVRGFDYDYVGVLWLKDLVRRNDRWVVQPDHVFETGIKRIKSRAIKSGDHSELEKSVFQAYRILFTRALRGVYVWVEDEETREYLRSCLSYPTA